MDIVKFKDESGNICPVYEVEDLFVVSSYNGAEYLYVDKTNMFDPFLKFPIIKLENNEDTLWLIPKEDVYSNEDPFDYFIRKHGVEKEILKEMEFTKAKRVKYIATSKVYVGQ